MAKEMRSLFVAYDIKNDRSRLAVSRKLEYYGLIRIQYSVFKGNVRAKYVRRMVEELREIELLPADRIHIIDLCGKCQQRQVLIGTEPEIKRHVII